MITTLVVTNAPVRAGATAIQFAPGAGRTAYTLPEVLNADLGASAALVGRHRFHKCHAAVI